MADVKWIKLRIDMFDDEKIKVIQNMPDGDALLVIWIRLLALAGKTNDNGYLYLSEDLPYTDEMLSIIFGKNISTVRMALQLFENLKMIENDTKGIYLVNFDKHQSLAKLDSIREYNKEKKKESRLRQKQSLGEVQNMSLTCQTCQDTEVELELDKELDLEEDKDKENIIVPIGTGSAKAERINYQLISDTWNNLGLPKITKIVSSSKRQTMIKARIRENGFEEFIQAINNISLSEFLLGKNDRGWIITFDWFIKPSNFIKVLEGNYNTNKANQQYLVQGKQTKVEKFNNMYSHDWDFDEIERLERDYIDKKIAGHLDGEH